jgi:hypothetical protein
MDPNANKIRIVLGHTKSGRVYVAQEDEPAVPQSEPLGPEPPVGASPAQPVPGNTPPAASHGDPPASVSAWARALSQAAQPHPRTEDGPSAHKNIEVHQTNEAYIRAVARTLSEPEPPPTLPVLASRYARVDAIPQVQTLSMRASKPRSDHVCLTLEEPLCVAAATLFARLGGRQLTVVKYKDWDRQLDGAVRSRSLTSVTLVLPYWDGEGDLDPRWLSTTVDALSRASTSDFSPVVGILTGADGGALTTLVAKALLFRGFVERYGESPALLVEPESDDSLGVVSPWRPDASRGLFRYSGERTDGQSAPSGPFSAVMFKGHGNAYCSCLGHVCSARPPEMAPDAPVDCCLFGLDCRRSSYPQRDIRQYDTALVVLHACNGGNPDSGLSRAGVPPLSLLAAAASPAAVISSNQTIKATGHLHMVGAISRARKAGLAVSRLNRFRRQTNFDADFYLIGDPELPSTMWHGQDWYDTTEAVPGNTPDRWLVNLERSGTAPYICVSLEQPPIDEKAWFGWNARQGPALKPGWAFHDEGRVELWFGAPVDQSALLTIFVERHKRPSIPAGLMRAAETVLSQTSWWKGPIAQELARVAAAGETVCACEKRIIQPFSVIPASPEQYAKPVNDATQTWIRAQRSCLEALLEARHAERWWWPWELTGVYRNETLTLDDDLPCIWCGRHPVIRHKYAVNSVDEREWWECAHCRVTADLPINSNIDTRFDVPGGAVYPGETAGTLTIGNPADAGELLGVGVVFVSMGGPMSCDPSIFTCRVPSGHQQTVAFQLSFEREPNPACEYGIRAVLLLNGRLHWLGRPFALTDAHRPELLAMR